MVENSSLLNKLRQNRHRTTVPERDDALVKPEPQTKPDRKNNKPPESGPAKISPLEGDHAPDKQEKPTGNNTLDDLKIQLANYPETQRHSAIVLEKELDQELTRYCKAQGVTVETFLEAAWQVASEDQVLLQRILEEAERRYRSRKEAGKLRRLITMLSKQ